MSFLIYINNLAQVSDQWFADDSNMIITGKNWVELAKLRNEELQ